MQWYDFVTIILFVGIIIIVADIIRTIKIKNTKFHRKLIILGGAILISIIIKITGAIYKTQIDGTTIGNNIALFVEAVYRSLGLLFFDYDDGIVIDLAQKSVPFASLYMAGTFLQLFTYIWVFVSLFKMIYYSIINSRRTKKLYKSGCDIILGFSDYAITYAKNSPNTVIWFFEELSDEKKDYLDNEGICYEVRDFDLTSLTELYKRFIRKRNSVFNFISFADNKDNLDYIVIFKKFLGQFIKNDKVDLKNLYLHIEIEHSNYITIKNLILSDSTYSSFIECFNGNDLIAQEFVEKYPITKFMPLQDTPDDVFINTNKACINTGKNANVVFIGYDDLAKSLFKSSVMNDQLTTIENGRVVPLTINYYALDENDTNKEDKNSIFYYDDYLNSLDNPNNNEEYFEKPAKPCNFTFIPYGVNKSEFYKSLVNLFTKDLVDTYNQVIVSFGNDMENLDYSLKLLLLFKQYNVKRFHIFTKIKSSRVNELSIFNNPYVTFFGSDDEFINHNVIVNDELHDIAKIINGQYDLSRGFGEDWYSKSAIKQLSSIYSGLNLRLKLNLLGYDYTDKTLGFDANQHKVYFEDLTNKLSDKMDLPYEDYLFDGKEFSVANALAYQEKLRWNAFYIINGYRPMKKKDIYFDKTSKRVYKDSDDLRQHACLTSVWGLDAYHRLIAKLVSENTNISFDKALDDTQTYKYDYMLMNNFDKLFSEKSKYVLVKNK